MKKLVVLFLLFAHIGVAQYNFTNIKPFTLHDTVFYAGQSFTTYQVEFAYKGTCDDSITPNGYLFLDTLVTFLQQHPKLILMIGAHDDLYNKRICSNKITQERAIKIVDYLVKKGIAVNRLTSKGYGPIRSKIDVPQIQKAKNDVEKQRLHGLNKFIQLTILATGTEPLINRDSAAVAKFTESRLSAIKTLMNLKLAKKNATRDTAEKKKISEQLSQLSVMQNLHVKNITLETDLYKAVTNAFKKINYHSQPIYFVEGMNYDAESNVFFISTNDIECFYTNGNLATGIRYDVITDYMISNCHDEGSEKIPINGDWFIVTRVSPEGISFSFFVDPSSYMRSTFINH